MRYRFWIVVVVSWLVGASVLVAQDQSDDGAKPRAAERAERTVEDIVRDARPSVVVMTHLDRDGKEAGVGSGFVIDADGLIATNYHVIGEARPIRVQLADGEKHDVTEVFASDRKLDLAIVRIDKKGLTALPLADSDELQQGQAIVAIGNPHGLKHSVTAGVVSELREIGGLPMIQVAVPIEPGNSGGPLLDMRGRVHGVLTLKSAITQNLGFAMPSNALRTLLEKPNPVPMDRWLTIGRLDDAEWKTLFGATWRQRAGRIGVEGLGDGFGGRSLCLYQKQPPKRPFEVAVTVRLDDEAGAAGLVFASDGGQLHYGFYPSAGRLRLSRFDGPDVFLWKVLEEKPSSAYRRGDWNTLKVRIEAKRIVCFVNDEQVMEAAIDDLRDGAVGLAKFRDTRAEFKGFRLAAKIEPHTVDPEVAKQITAAAGKLADRFELSPAVVDEVSKQGGAAADVLTQRAKELEAEADRLRRLADAAHQRHCQTRLAALLDEPEEKIDLFRATLLIAHMDNRELDIDAYADELSRMAGQVRAALPDKADDRAKLAALNDYLFKENGFHGSRTDYYNRANSYMNEVIDDREGLPITLSVLYMELAARLGVKVEGVGMPGHFIVRHAPQEGEPRLIDVFDSANPLSRDDAAAIVFNITGGPLLDEHLAPVAKRDIIIRMLSNLMRVAFEERGDEGPLPYLDALLAIRPDAGAERWMRMMLRARTNRPRAAIADADWLIEHRPAGVDPIRVGQAREALRRGIAE